MGGIILRGLWSRPFCRYDSGAVEASPKLRHLAPNPARLSRFVPSEPTKPKLEGQGLPSPIHRLRLLSITSISFSFDGLFSGTVEYLKNFAASSA